MKKLKLLVIVMFAALAGYANNAPGFADLVQGFPYHWDFSEEVYDEGPQTTGPCIGSDLACSFLTDKSLLPQEITDAVNRINSTPGSTANILAYTLPSTGKIVDITGIVLRAD